MLYKLGSCYRMGLRPPQNHVINFKFLICLFQSTNSAVLTSQDSLLTRPLVLDVRRLTAVASASTAAGPSDAQCLACSYTPTVGATSDSIQRWLSQTCPPPPARLRRDSPARPSAPAQGVAGGLLRRAADPLAAPRGPAATRLPYAARARVARPPPRRPLRAPAPSYTLAGTRTTRTHTGWTPPKHRQSV
jgi:hypothetical protein